MNGFGSGLKVRKIITRELHQLNTHHVACRSNDESNVKVEWVSVKCLTKPIYNTFVLVFREKTEIMIKNSTTHTPQLIYITRVLMGKPFVFRNTQKSISIVLPLRDNEKIRAEGNVGVEDTDKIGLYYVVMTEIPLPLLTPKLCITSLETSE